MFVAHLGAGHPRLREGASTDTSNSLLLHVSSFIPLLASVMLLASTAAGASAATAASTASPTGGDITKKQYDVLLRNFTPQEIVELDELPGRMRLRRLQNHPSTETPHP